MKKIFYSILITLIFASCSLANPQEFGNFRVEIPSGWTGELQNTTLVIKNDSNRPVLLYSRDTMIAVNRKECAGIEVTEVVS